MKKKLIYTVALSLLSLALSAEIRQPAFRMDEGELLALLDSPKTQLDDRITACQELGHRGGPLSVKPLVNLLRNSTPLPLFHAARYGLEAMVCREIDPALVAAAGRLEGDHLTGLLQTLGNRRSPGAVPLLQTALSSQDPRRVRAAAAALAKIGTPEAVKILEGEIGRSSIVEAYLLLPKKNLHTLSRLKERQDLSPALRNAALRAFVLSAPPEEAVRVWEGAIRSGEAGRVQTALSLVNDLPPTPPFCKAIAKAIREIPDLRRRLCRLLPARSFPRSNEVLLQLARGELGADRACRQEALLALARVGEKRAVPLLTEAILAEPVPPSPLLSALNGYSNGAAEGEIRRLLSSTETKRRLFGIRLLGLQRIENGGTLALGLVNDPVQEVRKAAIQALGVLSTPQELPAILALLEREPGEELLVQALISLLSRNKIEQREKIEILDVQYGLFFPGLHRNITETFKQALGKNPGGVKIANALCIEGGKIVDPVPNRKKAARITYRCRGEVKRALVREGEIFRPVLSTLDPALARPLRQRIEKAGGKLRQALIKTYGVLGTSGSLVFLRGELDRTRDPAIRELVIRLLCNWEDPAALPDLIGLAESAPNRRLRILALRGALRLFDRDQHLSLEERLSAAKRLVRASIREEEKSQALSLRNQLQEAADARGIGFSTIFNGRDLTGWEATNGFWRVEQGILTGESTARHPCKINHHIRYRAKKLRDFDLVLEARLSLSANSGIQIRSKGGLLGDNGYQADMSGDGRYAGYLYHPAQHLVGARGAEVLLSAEGRRAVKRFARSQDLQNAFRREKWNHFRIRCEGETLTFWMNGLMCCRLRDPRRKMLAEEGWITLQLHRGPPMKVEFRSIKLKEL